MNLAVAFEALGQREEAIGALRRLAKSETALARNRLWLAHTLARYEVWDQALEALTSNSIGSESAEDRYGGDYLTIRCLVELGRYDEAEDRSRDVESRAQKQGSGLMVGS